jgi:hypothetical protein
MFRFIELAGPLACPAGTTGHDVCEQQLWPGVREQFGVTGPTCAGATDLPADLIDGVAPPKPGGCCDAGDGSPVGLGLLTLLTTWMIARRGDRRHHPR